MKHHLDDVDDMIWQPKHGKGADDHQDEAAALSSALEPGILQTADHRGVTGVDEGERHQAAHNSLEQVLEDLVSHFSPMVRDAKSQSCIV